MAEDSSNNSQKFRRESGVRIFARELAAVELTAGTEETKKTDKFTPTMHSPCHSMTSGSSSSLSGRRRGEICSSRTGSI